MPAGRPKLQLDEKQITNYAKLGASNHEIAAMLGCSESVIRQGHREVLRKARAERRTMLRKLQWDAAKSGSAAILIWLGKNELDQHDKVEHSGVMKHEHNVSQQIASDPQAREHANALERRLAGNPSGNGVSAN